MSAHRLALAALAAAALAAPAWAGQPPALAQHAHAPHELALTLNNGARWATDAPLRQAMDALRAAVAGPVGALPDRIDAEVDFMIANCQLPPDADAQLHLVIERLVDAADRIRAGEAAEGRADAVAALNAYGAHFEHPGWAPIAP